MAQQWKYQGVELNEDLGLNLYEMDFRNYNPALGRFNSIDPLAEERNWLTPYNFVQNNPILRIDPSGLLDDYSLDTETGQLVLLRETDSDTDTIYTGTTNENGDFVKDGNSKTFSTKASNIRDVTIGEAEAMGYGTDPELSDDAQDSGLVFNEGFLQEGLEVMEFISFSTEIELNAWGFDNENVEGQGLSISAWSENDESSSRDLVGPSDTDFVSDSRGNRLGKKVGKVHTHPGFKGNSGLGYGDPSPSDVKTKNKGKNKNYPHFINSKNDGWTEY